MIEFRHGLLRVSTSTHVKVLGRVDQGLQPVKAAAIVGATALALIGGQAAAADTPDLEYGRSELRFDGYIRFGLGTSKGGDTQAEFQAPGAQSKYRLGNEANTNIELAADYRYRLDQAKTTDGPYVQGYFMADDFEPHGESDELGLDRVAQAYIKFANFFRPGVSVWVGRRYYFREGIHMNDHFWLNTGQGAHAGAGVEGIDFGWSKFKAAVFRLEDKEAPVGGLLNSTSVDLRLSEIKTNPGGAISLWGQYVGRHSNDSPLFDDEGGYGLGIWHDQANFLGLGGSNTVAGTYRHGAALVQGTFNARPVREDQGFDLSNAAAWEINNNFLMEPSDKWSMQWAVVLRSEDHGPGSSDKIKWYSTGIRPIYYISDHVNIAFELGYDYVDNEILDRKGGLTKATLALQLARGRGYYNRPVLRLFGTYARWSDAFEGLIGNTPGSAPYGDDTKGWTVGTQVEAWW